jgi:hypothetical protein
MNKPVKQNKTDISKTEKELKIEYIHVYIHIHYTLIKEKLRNNDEIKCVFSFPIFQL